MFNTGLEVVQKKKAIFSGWLESSDFFGPTTGIKISGESTEDFVIAADKTHVTFTRDMLVRASASQLVGDKTGLGIPGMYLYIQVNGAIRGTGYISGAIARDVFATTLVRVKAGDKLTIVWHTQAQASAHFHGGNHSFLTLEEIPEIVNLPK